MTMKMAFTTDEVTWRPSDSAEPSTARPSIVAMMPMTSAMKGALMSPTRKVLRLTAALQPRQEDVRADVAVEPGRDAAAQRAPRWRR